MIKSHTSSDYRQNAIRMIELCCAAQDIHMLKNVQMRDLGKILIRHVDISFGQRNTRSPSSFSSPKHILYNETSSSWLTNIC